jgi:hypothetical protein
MSQFTNPAELKKIAEEIELAERRAEQARKVQADKVAEDLKQAFQSREISPETPDRINAAIKRAAEQGLNEILVLRFPSEFCNDRGRRINNYEADWPDSLGGFSKTAFDYYAKELRPLGFTMRAEIMNYPGGMPGDVGMYLRW